MTDELNRHNDATGLVQSARQATGALPYLGDIEVVDKVLRQFTAGILDRFDQVGHGLLTPDAAADADGAECKRLGLVFTGGDVAYAAVPGWTTGALANHLRTKLIELLRDDGDDQYLVAQAFALFVHKVYGVITEMGASQHGQLQDELNEAIRSFTWLLIGLDSNE